MNCFMLGEIHYSTSSKVNISPEWIDIKNLLNSLFLTTYCRLTNVYHSIHLTLQSTHCHKHYHDTCKFIIILSD